MFFNKDNAPVFSSGWRYTAWLMAGCVVVFFFCARFPTIMTWAGISHEGVWFMDTYAILAALDAGRLGMDPYAYNPLNYFGGPHVYSHWWLLLGVLPLTRDDAFWLGLLVSFIAMLAAWIVLRPRNVREVVWGLFILCSAPLMLGLNRANVDLLLFALLSLCVPSMVSRSRFLRITGAPLLIAVGMGLKYYPAVAGLIVLAVRPVWDRRISLLLAVVLIVAVAIDIAPGITNYTSDRLPGGLYTFGAQLSLLAAGFSELKALVFTSALLFVTAWWFMQRPSLRDWKVPSTLQIDYLFFILGAVILTGSFMATVNYAYRWIFAVWMIPFLCRAQPSWDAPALRGLLIGTRVLLVAALWSDVFVALTLNLTVHSVAVASRWIGFFSALQQPFIWSFFVCLSGWLAHFVVTQLQSPGEVLDSSAPQTRDTLAAVSRR